MIVVDSSALIAILQREPERPIYAKILAGERKCVISAVNAHETATIMRLRQGEAGVERFWRLLSETTIEIVPFDEQHVRAAALAYSRYGKGIDAKARLNLADCAAYALAKVLGAPLLFKGNDFTHTDLKPCI